MKRTNFPDAFLKAWQSFDNRKTADDFFKSVNRISELIERYKKEKGNDNYVRWHEQKVRRYLVNPSLHNGTFSNAFAKEMAK